MMLTFVKEIVYQISLLRKPSDLIPYCLHFQEKREFLTVEHPQAGKNQYGNNIYNIYVVQNIVQLKILGNNKLEIFDIISF